MNRLTTQIYFNTVLNKHMTRIWKWIKEHGEEGKYIMWEVPTHKSQIRKTKKVDEMEEVIDKTFIKESTGTTSGFGGNKRRRNGKR